MLVAQALRACRLVVDTGIHHKQWTRNQALEFMTENLALSEHVITIEVDRYIIWPGQALSYMVGMKEIQKLQAQASQVLGSSFDLKSFHDQVLAQGAVPMTILANQIRQWVESVSDPNQPVPKS